MHADHISWRELSSVPVFQHRLFTMRSSRQRAADGQEGNFYLLDAPDWVNTAALEYDAAGDAWLIMVRQYRFGSASCALEFPGGVIDPGESPRQAAERELREETGYSARRWIELGSINPNASFMTNRTHAWLALDLESSGKQELDTEERIDIQRVRLADLKAGKHPEFFVNGVMLITWCWLQAWLEQQA